MFTLHLKRLGARASLALLILAFSSSAFAWGSWFKFWKPEPLPTITGTVLKSGGDFDHNPNDFDILLNAVLAVGLEGALDNPEASLTVFAPTDAAFIALANDLGYEGHDEEGAFLAIASALTELGGGDLEGVLTNVLLYHVSPEKLKLRNLLRTRQIETLLTDTTILRFGRNLVDNEPELTNPRIQFRAAATKASNGLIYPIDKVLIPIDIPSGSTDTITDLVVASGGDFDTDLGDFDVLLNAVLAAGIEGVLADPSASLTVFAPTDYAFVLLARDLGYHGYDEGEAFAFIAAALTDLGGGELVPILTDVLTYHVVPGSLTFKEVLEASELSTALEGTSFEVSGRKLIDNDPGIRDPRLLLRARNLDASNGRVHGINRVLIPVQITE